MIHFALSDFFFNENIINYFSYIDTNYLKRKDISFYCAIGNFPFCYWNGGFNNNIDTSVVYTDILDKITNTSIPIRFNCNNVYLTQEDFEDTFANLILSLGENASNSISISNFKLLKFLQERYPNYKYVFSKEANLIEKFTPEIVNTILNNENFLYFQIPEELGQNLDFLKQIDKKEKIEVPINYICNKDCNRYNMCLRHEHQAQYNFSGYNNFFHCAKTNGLNSTIIPFDQITQYEKIGITHFYLNPVVDKNKEKSLLFLIDYFIKDEYKIKVLEEFEG